LERGLERGRHENTFEIARRMKASKFDIESIMKMTNLSREEITNL
jgi:predicted transposase/invertase (TIGR01784 family)